MSSKQLSTGSQYNRYINKQVPSCERGIVLCSKRRTNKDDEDIVSGGGKGGEDGEQWREGRGGSRKKGCLQPRRGYVLFPACCCTQAHISQAIMIDSFGISEGICARGNGCARTHVQVCIPLLMSSFSLLTPMCCVHGWPETATRERSGSVGARERKERKCSKGKHPGLLHVPAFSQCTQRDSEIAITERAED